MRGFAMVASVLAAIALVGCASASEAEQQPGWYAEQEAQLEDTFPSLQSVPRESDANTDAAYWARVQADLSAAGLAVRANPRSQPVTAADDPQLFLDEARREIEETRQSHEPN